MSYCRPRNAPLTGGRFCKNPWDTCTYRVHGTHQHLDNAVRAPGYGAATAPVTPLGADVGDVPPPRPRPTRANQLLDEIPYPRGEQRGPLADANGVPLHGAYERKVADGYQTTIINNGRVAHSYRCGRPGPAAIPGDRHSYANLVLGALDWAVPDDSERPITNYPASEYPSAEARNLWDSHFVMQQLLAGRKPCGDVNGSPEQAAAWCAQAEAAGFVTRVVRAWTNGLGHPTVFAGLARPGPLLVGNEEQYLYDAYEGLIGDVELEDALDELGAMTGEDFLLRDWGNPVTTQDFIITGHALGYPPLSTVAVIDGTHS